MKTEQEIKDKLESLKNQYETTQKVVMENEKFQNPIWFHTQIGVKHRIELLEWVLK